MEFGLQKAAKAALVKILMFGSGTWLQSTEKVPGHSGIHSETQSQKREDKIYIHFFKKFKWVNAYIRGGFFNVSLLWRGCCWCVCGGGGGVHM